MSTENINKKLEQIRSKGMAHYALFNGVIAALGGVVFVVFFHLVNGGNGEIINEPGEYIFFCSGIFAVSAIGSCFGWKMREDPNQKGEANGKI